MNRNIVTNLYNTIIFKNTAQNNKQKHIISKCKTTEFFI